jgi:hypothetical protein
MGQKFDTSVSCISVCGWAFHKTTHSGLGKRRGCHAKKKEKEEEAIQLWRIPWAASFQAHN